MAREPSGPVSETCTKPGQAALWVRIPLNRRASLALVTPGCREQRARPLKPLATDKLQPPPPQPPTLHSLHFFSLKLIEAVPPCSLTFVCLQLWPLATSSPLTLFSQCKDCRQLVYLVSARSPGRVSTLRLAPPPRSPNFSLLQPSAGGERCGSGAGAPSPRGGPPPGRTHWPAPGCGRGC